jgi:hypothetical protein
LTTVLETDIFRGAFLASRVLNFENLFFWTWQTIAGAESFLPGAARSRLMEAFLRRAWRDVV